MDDYSAIVDTSQQGCIVYYQGGMAVDIAYPAKPSILAKPSPKRGKIKGFSRASRKRLMHLLGEIDKSEYERAYFITLTYPEHYPDWVTAKAHFDAFYKRMVRKFGDFPVLWRAELQARGAIHFHCIAFLGVDVLDAELSAIVAGAWYEVAGGGDPYHYLFHIGALRGSKGCASRVGSMRRVLYYVSKYVAKVNEFEQGIGRFWGLLGKRFLRFARKVRVYLPVGMMHNLMRFGKRFMRIPNRVRFRKLSWLMFDSDRFWRSLEYICSP